MSEQYVIFGYEWLTKQRGAPPEACEYLVLKVIYDKHNWFDVQVNNAFLEWVEEARNRVWKNIVSAEQLTESYSGAERFIKSFVKESDYCWYILSEVEYKDWLDWKEEGGNVEVGVLDLTAE